MDNGGCEHICVNVPGSFECQCNPGYGILPDMRHCRGKTCNQITYTDNIECWCNPDCKICQTWDAFFRCRAWCPNCKGTGLRYYHQGLCVVSFSKIIPNCYTKPRCNRGAVIDYHTWVIIVGTYMKKWMFQIWKGLVQIQCASQCMKLDTWYHSSKEPNWHCTRMGQMCHHSHRCKVLKQIANNDVNSKKM